MMSAVASVLGFVAPATKIEKIWKQIKSMGASIVMMLTFIFAAIQKKPCVNNKALLTTTNYSAHP